MARVDGVTTAAVPIEHLALDGDGNAVVPVGTFVVLLVAAITRASDGYGYDWTDSTFKASPASPTTALVAVDATNYPGLYHVAGGFTVPADDTYTITVTDAGGLAVATVPAVTTLVVGTLAGTATLGTNLVDEIFPIVDELRDLHTEFGTRPYHVDIVRRLWSGTDVGRGACRVVYKQRLSPDPGVVLDDSHTLTDGGLQEQGTATLSQVSLSCTQTDLGYYDLADNEEIFYLLTDAHGQGIQRRLYLPGDHPVPHRADKTDAAGWSIELRRTDCPPNVIA